MDNLISQLILESDNTTWSKSHRKVFCRFKWAQLERVFRIYFKYYTESDQYLWHDQHVISHGQLKAFINHAFLGTKDRQDIDDIFSYLFKIYRAFVLKDPEAQEQIEESRSTAQVSSSTYQDQPIDFDEPVYQSSSFQITLDIPANVRIGDEIRQDRQLDMLYQRPALDDLSLDNIVDLRSNFNDRTSIADELVRRRFHHGNTLSQPIRAATNPRATNHHLSNQIFNNLNLLTRALNESGLADFLELHSFI